MAYQITRRATSIWAYVGQTVKVGPPHPTWRAALRAALEPEQRDLTIIDTETGLRAYVYPLARHARHDPLAKPHTVLELPPLWADMLLASS